jgi:hypothetical protein
VLVVRKEGRKDGRGEGEGHDHAARKCGDDKALPGVKSQGPGANDYTRRKHGDDNSPPGVKSQGTRVTFAPQEKGLEGFNQERDSMKKGRREGIQGRTEQEGRTLRCTHVQMYTQACKQKRQEGVTDLANLKRNQ